jgi:hypothetical protein
MVRADARCGAPHWLTRPSTTVGELAGKADADEQAKSARAGEVGSRSPAWTRAPHRCDRRGMAWRPRVVGDRRAARIAVVRDSRVLNLLVSDSERLALTQDRVSDLLSSISRGQNEQFPA